MKRPYFAPLLVLVFITTRAEEHKWYQGKVILITNEVVNAEISRAPLETLLLRVDGKHSVLPAHKVKSYYYYDEDKDINRRFDSYVQYYNNIPLVSFYECVVSGEWSVWRRQKIHRPVIEEKRMDAFSYYVKHNERMVPLRFFKKELYPVLASACRSDNEAQAELRKLRPGKPADVISMAKRVNSLLALQSNLPAGRNGSAVSLQ
jgi:hypothetical protein